MDRHRSLGEAVREAGGPLMSSMLYTMGMALDRAAENGFAVALLVDGSWIEGQVAANDGVGVVLENDERQHCVVKADRIAAVRIHAESPYHVPIARSAHAGAFAEQPQFDGAMPMPGPRAAEG